MLFLAKFDLNGNLLWGTYYGGEFTDESYAIDLDFHGNIYIAGYTSSHSGMATKGAYMESFAGGVGGSASDAFVAKFRCDGILEWGTYYGGFDSKMFVERVNALNVSNSADIFICGHTTSKSNIATPGALQPDLRGYSGDMFVAKFSQNPSNFEQSPIPPELGPDQYICEEDSNFIVLDAGKGFIRYKWYPNGDTTQAVIVRKQGDYFVVVDERCGSHQDGIKIKSSCPAPLFMPNAFTPNNDGHNDDFKPITTEALEYSLIIYNRWGQKIFSSNDINQGWDGTLQGANVPEGPYLWLLDYRLQEKEAARRYFKSGTVELMR